MFLGLGIWNKVVIKDDFLVFVWFVILIFFFGVILMLMLFKILGVFFKYVKDKLYRVNFFLYGYCLGGSVLVLYLGFDLMLV